MRIPNPLCSLVALLPISAVVAGCAVSTQDDSASQSDPISGGIIRHHIFPSTPALYGVMAFPHSVTVRWVSPDASMTEFVVYKRDAHWAWQPVHTVANKPGTSYAWVDTDRSLSAQCYMVTAVNSMQLASSTQEQCTVRPDSSVFPQSAPTAAQNWFGLSPQNDGVAPLEWGEGFLQTQHQTWGVSLGLGESPGDNVKAERQSGGTSWPLMEGEAIAIRVWGAGWLTHGQQTWGVDLKLSDTPSYEWYVVDGGVPGHNLDSGSFALYNKTADDFLVRANQTWGVDLNWYKKTLPSTGGGGTPPSGVKTLTLYNCHSEERPVEMWVADVTAGTGFVDKGRIDEQWSSGGCPAYGSTPWTFSPTSGHAYIVRAIDFTVDNCAPDISGCARKEMTFVGDANGQTFVDAVN